MKNKYLVDFQNYFKALNFKFIIQYYNDDTLNLVVENEDGEVETIYEDTNDNASTHILDVKVKDFLLDRIQEKLLSYGSLNIIRRYSPWNGFVIEGITFNVEAYKNDYNLFLKNILHFVEQCTQDTNY